MKANRGITLVLMTVVALLALSGCSRSITGTAVAAPSTPGQSASDGAVKVGSGGREITMYVDFLCPACANLEKRDGAAISSAITAGTLTVAYRPMAFLDRQSASGTYSSRAIKAFAATAKDSSPVITQRFVTALFAAQPREGGPGDLTDPQIAEVAAKAGVPAATVAKIRDGKTGVDAAAIAAANLNSLQGIGGTGTPTVVNKGTIVDLTDTGWLQKVLAG